MRLAAVLDDGERAELARKMAEHVVAAAAPLPVTVVCDDPAVAAWAAGAGAQVVWTPGLGLDGAVAAGVATLAAAGLDRVVVAHADLPRAGPLGWAAGFAGVTLVPDHRDDGTNVACVPARAGFRFAYGAGSLLRHSAEARRLGLGVRVVRHHDLGRDVDVPADLAFLPTLACS